MKKVLTIIAFVFLGILAVITLFPFLEHSLCFRRYNDCYGSHRRVSFIRINEFEVPF